MIKKDSSVVLKAGLKKERNEVYEKIVQLKLIAFDEKIFKIN
jgi:hypothetical protein